MELIFCVECLELSHFTHDLFQADKKITVVTSWATDKMKTIFTQNDNLNHFGWNRCHFLHLLSLQQHLFSYQLEISHVLIGTTSEIQQRKGGPKFLTWSLTIKPHLGIEKRKRKNNILIFLASNASQLTTTILCCKQKKCEQHYFINENDGIIIDNYVNYSYYGF